ncbi:GAP family protein [Vagococcus fluvialis]|uniref:GAP family protein n=1 Tax=Vagococcus fluvialis TaxID=2738 RepID=UPI003D13D49D
MELLKQIVTPAIGIAISPLPIVGLIVILLGNQAKKNSFYYSIGWLLGNVTVFTIGLVFMGSVASGKKEPGGIEKIVYATLGCFLLYVSVKTFIKSFNKKEINTPKWFEKLTTLDTRKSLLFSILLSAANPKNLLLALSAGAATGAVTQGIKEDVLAIIIFSIFATFTIVFPTILFFIYGNQIKPSLNKLKEWLILNNDSITAVIFLFIGIKIIGKIF